MQIIHYVPCSCQLLDSCECGVTTTRPTPPVITDCPTIVVEQKPCPSPPKPPSPDKPVVVVAPGPGGGGKDDPPPSDTSSISSLSPTPPRLRRPVEEPSTIDKIYSEVRRGGLNLSFFIANYQFTAFSTTLTSQWRLNLVAAVIITNVQHAFRSLLAILVAWPANSFLGSNFTRIFSVMSYTIYYLLGDIVVYTPNYACARNAIGWIGNSGLILIYDTYPSLISNFFVPGLLLVTLGQCMSDTANKNNELEKVDDEKKGVIVRFDSFNTSAQLVLKNLWQLLKRYWVEVIGFIVVVFLFPGQEKGLWIVIWLLVASSGLNLLGQFCIKLRKDGIDGTCGGDVLRRALDTSSSIQSKWTRIRYVWSTIDKKILLRTSRLSLVFLPYIIMSEVAENYFFQQAQEMKRINIFGKAMPAQAFALSTQLLAELVQRLSHWLYTKIEDSNAPRSRFYGTIRVGLAMILAIPCFVIASVVDTKRWEDTNTSVLFLIPQLIIIAIVDGLASDGIDCFFEQELPDSIGIRYGFLFVKGIEFLGKLLTTLWNVFWANVTRSDGNPGWLDEKDNNLHQLDRYYSVMAVFADASCIIFVCVAYRYSIKSYKWR